LFLQPMPARIENKKSKNTGARRTQ